jgi:hypothetical protein
MHTNAQDAVIAHGRAEGLGFSSAICSDLAVQVDMLSQGHPMCTHCLLNCTKLSLHTFCVCVCARAEARCTFK